MKLRTSDNINCKSSDETEKRNKSDQIKHEQVFDFWLRLICEEKHVAFNSVVHADQTLGTLSTFHGFSSTGSTVAGDSHEHATYVSAVRRFSYHEQPHCRHEYTNARLWMNLSLVFDELAVLFRSSSKTSKRRPIVKTSSNEHSKLTADLPQKTVWAPFCKSVAKRILEFVENTQPRSSTGTRSSSRHTSPQQS